MRTHEGTEGEKSLYDTSLEIIVTFHNPQN